VVLQVLVLTLGGFDERHLLAVGPAPTWPSRQNAAARAGQAVPGRRRRWRRAGGGPARGVIALLVDRSTPGW
jgi:hypothetical protein